ncbi:MULTISPECIES: hypothetical protein [unclassified Sphingomonas]|uniref:hypothetical protein n=1 Tax=unclassified Sphingomonas TaxID=196159 RepID=UPI0006F9B63D|nr:MULTISPECIES: hypothetical protein [unclassified Sphingomonas]KQM61833.1 hypothetical protein ASE65_06390 [Sphingomonas sp. Leaf16]KQN13106.1 hypothetical protein ASE81_07405 [Sphingomonas sp. Leaf29]KQN19993.1 hypothetical protein ASE83_07330 [Sphingomonas sp. Leaf32]
MIRAVSILLPLVLLAACNQSTPPGNDVDALDAELLRGNAGDPAVTAALQDQIMVDPSLTGQSGNGAVKPADRPYSAAAPAADVASGSAARPESLESAPKPGACPSCKGGHEALTLGELAAVQNSGNRQCAAKVGYSAAWANRLPAAFALHPDARLSEAAGTDADGCRMRVVSFTIAQPVDRMVDWYYTRAKKGGYSAEHQAEGGQHVLGGTRGTAAYAVFLSPEGRGTSVDLIVDGG